EKDWAPPEYGVLTAIPRSIYESSDEARAALEPYLNAWAAFMELTMECPVEFRFVASKDHAGNPMEIHSTRERFLVIGPIRGLPPPPQWLGAEPALAQALRLQWQATRLGRAKPLDRAYWCWTLLRATY